MKLSWVELSWVELNWELINIKRWVYWNKTWLKACHKINKKILHEILGLVDRINIIRKFVHKIKENVEYFKYYRLKNWLKACHEIYLKNILPVFKNQFSVIQKKYLIYTCLFMLNPALVPTATCFHKKQEKLSSLQCVWNKT